MSRREQRFTAAEKPEGKGPGAAAEVSNEDIVCDFGKSCLHAGLERKGREHQSKKLVRGGKVEMGNDGVNI